MISSKLAIPQDLNKREAIMLALRSLWLLDCFYAHASCGNNDPDYSGTLYESGDQRYEQFLTVLEELKTLDESELRATLKKLVKIIITPSNPTPKEIIDSLIEEQQESNFERGWVIHRLAEHPQNQTFELEDWRYVATRLGYSSAWAWHQYVAN